jgi:hypothetical protein
MVEATGAAAYVREAVKPVEGAAALEAAAARW